MYLSVFSSITSFEFPLFLILAALILLLFTGVKVSGIGQWQEEPLSLETSKAIQGFCAVAIIIHHLSQALEERAGVLGFFSELGVLFVGVFFFFSGYGLYTSLKTKENYLKGFLKKRLVTILIPFYVCILVFVAAACISGMKFKGLELLAVISGWTLLNSHMWYIVEIAILYLAFFFIYKFIKNRTVATAVMAVFVLLMMTGSLLLAHGEDYSCRYWFQGEWWYNSSFLFVLGIIVSKHSETLRKIARKGYYIFLTATTVLTGLLGIQTSYALATWSYWSEIPGVDPAYGDKFHCLLYQLPWIIVFVCFLLLLMMKVRFGNPVLKFLGSIAIELYLIHNLFLIGLADGSVFPVRSASMYILLTILLSVGLATVLHGLDKYIIKHLLKKKES
ncbi:MAG: acyltransferase [Clostridiales bacterium]|nr:acyltransferase [Clostridiales bacterium]